MHIVSSGQTDVGLQREHNEDAYLIDPVLGLYVVCDGVGGQAAGEVASQQTVQIVHAALRRERAIIDRYLTLPSFENRREILALVENVIQEACAKVYDLAESDLSKKGMGTTIAMLLALGNAAVIAHVGDSRVYLLRGEQAHQLTEDHSLAWELVKSGAINKDFLEHWPFANVITRCVGSQATTEVDTLFVECVPGDRFLVCSDGFHCYIENDDDLVVLGANLTPHRFVESCIALANERGGRDNITVIVAQVDQVVTPTTDLDVTVTRKVDILRRISLFEQCSYNEMVKILSIVRIRSFKPGEVIIQEDTVGDEFFVLLLGRLQVLKGGQELLTIAPGSPFGEVGLLEDVPRSATVQALDLSRVMLIRRHDFYDLLEQEPQMAVKLMRSFLLLLSHRLRVTSSALMETRSALSALERRLVSTEGTHHMP